uniref:Protein sidekick-2 n=1 Tax=Magallana gigas TaxID=29159 RepID=K1Q4V6_MAGGI
MEKKRAANLQFVLWIAVYFQCVKSEEPPLYFSREPECGSAVAERGVKILICQSYSNPAPVYRWLREGTYVSQESLSGTFKMYSINRTEAGSYRCRATNRLGSIISDSCRVNVAYLDPLTSVQDETVNVQRGHGFKIHLPSFKSYPFPPTVEWHRNSNIMANEGPNHQVTLSKDLVLLDTQTGDDGHVYQAEISNGLNGETSTTQSYTIKVSDSGGSSNIGPEMIVSPKDTTANQEDYTVDFECIVNARPISYLSTKWYRVEDGTETELVQNSKYLLSGGYHRILTIKSPETSDTGLYCCKASYSGQTYPPVILDANLTVYESPVIISQIETQYVRDFSQNITIHCQGQGTPAPTMLWYFNSQLVQSTQKITVSPNGTLSITFLDMTDSGVYMCFARNEAGETKKATWIKVNSSEIINKPDNLTITEGSNARLPCEATGAPKPTVSWRKIFCLSNFYPCELNVFGISHKSAEHAFQYIKAMRSGDIPRATSIQSAATALDAKKIGKLIIPSPSFTEKRIAIMTEILEAKADQIHEFSDLLKKHKKSVFVETTYDDFWASGLDKEATIHTRASAWPGTNKFGIIMSGIAGRLRRSPGRSHSASGPKTRTASKDKSKTQQLQISEMIQDIRKTQNSGGSVTKKTATTSQVRDSHARTAEG